jgi:hypothetical protein
MQITDYQPFINVHERSWRYEREHLGVTPALGTKKASHFHERLLGK